MALYTGNGLATITGAGAGATTTATLTMADSNGAVIADRPQAASVAAADTGRVTWALGLTDTGQVSSASAWVLLDTVTLTASGTIAFDSITQATYQHLRLVGQVRGVNGNQLGLQFNGSGGTAYNSTWVTAEGDAFGQSVLNGAVIGGPEFYWQYTASSGGLGDTDTDSFSRFTIDIPFYRSDTKKDVIVEMFTRVQNGWYAVHGGGQWEDVSPITRCDVYEAQVPSANFLARSSVSLYGGL